MRSVTLSALLLATLALTPPAFASDGPKPEFIAEKMAFKFARGVTNIATAVVELPKQSYLSVRDRGTVGYVIGPLKGIGMTAYRAFIGAAETVFFLVPQPGYYDPMIEPDYVWKGWEEPRGEPGQVAGEPAEKRGDSQ
ncbi:exosortase system-associated protein, TIGR04073 family [Geobacter pickeringii]|uniref:Exosortase n=1 Tax=Geobacter pickeringii TaxID=345632 RepID=A0A0B5BK28_9BACT|nr:exosortase system-associated protein, TIGR04073 family [Geobacter pickeringii]AJE04421.1 hypothetical protein GPICK_14610 [Geobacter pickeringii]